MNETQKADVQAVPDTDRQAVDGAVETGGQRLEDVLAQVEYCIAQLENPQISLEDSFQYYEEGVRKLKLCNEKVAQIEQKMLVISGQGALEDF